jgi:hypothetical protein
MRRRNGKNKQRSVETKKKTGGLKETSGPK